MDFDIKKYFQKLCLDDNEAKVYLVCLGNPTGYFAHQIVKETGINRSTVIVVVDRLLERGYITSHIEGARRKFFAVDLQKIISEYKEDLDGIAQLIPIIVGTMNTGVVSKIRFFEGPEGVKNIFRDIRLTLGLRQGSAKELLTIASAEHIFQILPNHNQDHVEKRIKERIPLRWIAPDTEFHRKFVTDDPNAFRVMKLFDSNKYPIALEFDIYDHSIAFISADIHNPSGIVIENKNLADSMRSIFNMMWGSL